MNDNVTQIAIFNKATNSVIGLRKLIEYGGTSILENSCRVSLCVTVIDQKSGNEVILNIDTEISCEQFSVLENGGCTATVNLQPIITTKETNIDSTYCITQTTRNDDHQVEQQKGLTTKPKIKKRFGTSGIKKYFGSNEVSWSDVVILAKNHMGRNILLPTLYEWAEQNITWLKDGQHVSICNIKNWRASIRQNRKSSSTKESASVHKNKPVDQNTNQQELMPITARLESLSGIGNIHHTKNNVNDQISTQNWQNIHYTEENINEEISTLNSQDDENNGCRRWSRDDEERVDLFDNMFNDNVSKLKKQSSPLNLWQQLLML